MKVARLAVVVAIILGSASRLHAQTSPSLENGWKPFGSYDGSHLDTVNLMNGNLMLHAPLLPNYPQRGKFGLSYVLTFNSKTWQVLCQPNTNSPSGEVCGWFSGGTGVSFQHDLDLAIQRTADKQGSGTGLTFYSASGYSITGPDGAIHQLYATVFANNIPVEFESVDLTGYHLVLSGSDENGVPNTATVTDRQGNRYVATFPSFQNCSVTVTTNHLPDARVNGGSIAPAIDDSPFGDEYCPQLAATQSVTDSNGNTIGLSDPATSNPPVDTLGRTFPLGTGAATTDYSGCVSAAPIIAAWLMNYNAPDGTARQMKVCYSSATTQTAFHLTLPDGTTVEEAQDVNFSAGQNSPRVAPGLATVILADGSKWAFAYDTYGEMTSVSLPTGGSISYTWTNITQADNCAGDTKKSRAVATRILDDGRRHIYKWSYTWGTPSNGVISNLVTDPLFNDTAHVFTALDGPNGCAFYETRTQYYKGSQSAGQLLKQVDTSYYPVASFSADAAPATGNVVIKDITTTVFPSGKASKIHREYDTGLGTGKPIFGNVVREQQYDWGQGTPGALLRETDTVYQWQKNPAYLTAGLLDLPASVVIISPNAAENTKSGCPINASGGTASCMAETDYSYDEPGYLTTPTPAVTKQHNSAPPAGVRGNQTTVSRWLNTMNSFVTSHTNWYDTGEVYQSIDPLGHTTTHSYDPFYVGAYATQTCSPTTNSITHCVSGTYDFNTGVLTSLTNENAGTQASGNSPGDSGHTSNYTYDSMFRITSAQAPPDPANSGLHAQTNFTFSSPGALPVTVQRTKSVTSALSDSATSFFDGLGRGYQSQHVLPNGTATVDTTFDLAGHPATVSNPYFTTSDPTYGNTTNAYDGLDRVTQTTKQDGSISKVAYSVLTSVAANGDCTVTTDEAGKQRGTCADALGRLVEVDEPTGATVQANYHALMQQDGNFAVLNSAGTSVWSTGSGATNAASIFMQDDGNLVTYIFKWQAGVYAAASPGPFPSSSCSIGTYLVAGEILPSGKCIVSPHGQYFLLMNTDGNFFIYDWAHGTGTWGPGTQGHPGAYAIFQTDGNLVVYDVNGTALWNSGTSGTFAERLDMNDDGRIIIWKSAWNSGTSDGQFNGTTYAHPSCDVGLGTGTTGLLWPGQCFVSPNGRFELLLQTDGNMVIYDRSVTPNAAIWSTGTGFSTADPAVSYRTLYFYDALGNLTCVEQHGDATTGTGCSAAPSSDASSPWRVRRFTYDSLSRLLTATNPESGTITYTYDADGELLQKTSPAPNPNPPQPTQTVSYCYDELHRVTGKGYGAQSCPLATPVATYAYDSGDNAKGHLTSLLDQAGTANYAYDILGRLTTETRTLTGANNGVISKTVSYEYNLDGSLYKLHYPSGAVLTYTPDSAGRTVSAVDSGSGINYVTGATYGPDSALTGFVSGSGGAAAITNSFTFNKRLQPLTMSATAPSQTVFSIGYDFHAGNGTANSGTDNGNVYGIINYKDTSHGRDQTFTYDALNRLISAQNAGTNCSAMVLGNKTEYWGNSYGYDAWGNLLQKNVTKCGAEGLTVTADAHNWIHATAPDYQYDAAGNMTYDATAALSYTFDQENRLTGAAGYTYTYDGDGNRVRKSNGNLAANGTLYWYMTPGVVAESDLAGTLKSEYVFFDGERVARRDGATGTGGVFYYFSDHLKTASVITDSAGVIKAESDYYPWGGELQFVNNDPNDYKFTGKKRDLETGLDYFGARYYSNGLGRWVSADWSAMPVPVPYADFGDPQSLNQYSYVRNLPTTRIDADGHCCAPYELADKVDAWINMSVKATQDRAPSMNPVAAAGDVFVTGSAGDLVKGFTNLLRIGESAGSLPEGSSTTDKIIAGAEEGGRVGGMILAVVGVAGPKGEVGANAGESGTSAGTGGRLPQDINVNPQAPAANSGNGKVGPSATQNAAAQGDAAAAKAAGHTDIRMNQQQVNASGVRVGKNRPDLQSTDPKGVRHYTEYDRNAQNAAAHHARTKANDPNGVTHTNVGP
jgi:RHS repeat-associated protein